MRIADASARLRGAASESKGHCRMASDPKSEAALALHRFGLGPRAGSIAAIASDPRGALLAELDRPGAGRIVDANLPTSGTAARAALEFQQKQRVARQAAQRLAQQARQSNTDATPPARRRARPSTETPGTPSTPPAPRPNAGPAVPQQLYLDEAKARIDAAPAPTSASRNASYGSGRIISAYRPTRAACVRSAVRTSAKRSARTCSAASATCCRRSRPTRRC